MEPGSCGHCGGLLANKVAILVTLSEGIASALEKGLIGLTNGMGESHGQSIAPGLC
jgi:hypothetical protein